MTALPSDAVADLYKLVAELEQRLESSFAAHDAAIARATATAQENIRLRNELAIARERQNASADILGTIANISGDAERALYQIAETSARLFGAPSATIHIAEGDGWSRTIRFGDSSRRVGAGVPDAQLKIGGRNMPGTIVGDNRQVNIADVDNVDPAIADWPGLPYVRDAGTRSMSGSPLRREGNAIGALIVYRDRLAPFTDEEMALQQSFADQAAIAIENARLFNETKEALSRQTATAEILRVISQSPTDVQPVFDAIVVSAVRLLGCEASFIQLCDGDHFWGVARCGREGLLSLHNPRRTPVDPSANFPSRAIVEKKTLHLPDWSEIELPEFERRIQESLGYNSAVYLPLLREGECIAVLGIAGSRPRMFGETEIALAESFRDQALIAIENTRLFNETREALERQTATADILKVIASSPSDAQPVFEAIAHSARRLLGGFSAAMFRYIDGSVHLAAFTPVEPTADAALKADFPAPVDDFAAFRLARDGQPFAIPDTEELSHTPVVEIARKHGFRSMLWVPMVSGGVPIGLLSVTRAEPGAFAPHHTQLLQTFADQAVIAIENVRLFNEVQERTNDLSESLQQQTATADVLKVISRSVFDLQTVLDTLVESAYKLCGSRMGLLYLRGDEVFECKAIAGAGVAEAIPLFKGRPIRAGRGTAAERVIMTGEMQSVTDFFDDPEFDPRVSEAIRTASPESGLGQLRSTLAVPMMRDDAVIGVIAIASAQTGPFPPRQIELLKTFADQAVIAIENARLFDEVQARTRDLSESLQFQTATSDVLKVISRSPDSLQPVLDVIVETSRELCGSDASTIFLMRDRKFHVTAVSGSVPSHLEYLRANPLAIDQPGSVLARMTREKRTLHIPNVADDPELNAGATGVGGPRALLVAPLMRDGIVLGAIVLRQSLIKPFTSRQIDAIETFADQAVIAISNVNLFEQVQARTRDLSEALTHQTGSANILRVIASSPTDVNPVLTAIVESACELCEADDALASLRDGDELVFQAQHGTIPVVWQRQPVDREGAAGLAVIERTAVHVHDLLGPEGERFPRAREFARTTNVRTVLCVPLLREGESIGVIVLRRTEVRPFSDKQIALLQTFADQAVIAIGNVRLFEEVQARTRELTEALTYQTASTNILRVIASSPTDVAPVLKAIVDSAVELCNAHDAIVLLSDGDFLRFSEHHGPIPIGFEKWPINRRWTAGRAFVDRKTVHLRDLLSDEGDDFPDSQELARQPGHRSILSVPLLRENESIGVIALRRTEVQPFSEKQIALLQTFADQAVIAIGNVRLFEEVQQRTRELSESLEQQTATSEVLSVISRSAGDLEPVFQSMLENATRICGAQFGLMNLHDGERFHTVGFHNVPPAFAVARQQSFRAHPDSDLGQMVRTKKFVHIDDLRARPAYLAGDPATVQLADLAGARTILIVPMVKDDEFVGTIGIYRLEVSPFNEKQIALLSSFASQAVIAIENTRLLKELRERTDDLTKSLNDLRTAQDRLVQTEKLASLGQLTAGIAHEIKNPLNFVNNFAALSAELTDELNDVLKQVETTETIRGEVDELTGLLKANLQKVVQHGQRADSIVKNMLLHSREGSGDHRPADINALIDESLNLAYHGARAEKPQFNVTLRRDFDPAAGMIEAFPQEITRVFLNLISNGFYAVTRRKSDENGEFEPLLTAVTRSLGEAVEIRIRDNGTGIPPEVKEKMFNPFFTTKPAGEGTGLGLSMSHDIIVKQHGGTIDVDTEPGQFTEFRIVLPRTSKSSK